MKRAGTLVLFAAWWSFATACADPLLRALIVDGQNNHDWQPTTPILKEYLERSGLVRVDVATTPPAGEDLSGFRPRWSDYHVVFPTTMARCGPRRHGERSKHMYEAAGTRRRAFREQYLLRMA